MSRNEISKAASEMESQAKSKGATSYNGTPESEKEESAWFGIAGEFAQLSNDCCETQHTVKSLRSRLIELKAKFNQARGK